MTTEEIYQSYDGIIPDDLRKTIIHESYENYCRAFLLTAEKNFSRRCREIIRSLCSWRLALHYPLEIQKRMLDMMSNALFRARDQAVAASILAFSVSQPSASASAVIAPPIKTV